MKDLREHPSGFLGVIDLLEVAKHGKGENVYLVRFHDVRPTNKRRSQRKRIREGDRGSRNDGRVCGKGTLSAHPQAGLVTTGCQTITYFIRLVKQFKTNWSILAVVRGTNLLISLWKLSGNRSANR